MIVTTTESISGREILEVLGLVSGNVVCSKHIGRDIMAGLKSIVGGEIKGYTELMTESRQIALSRLIEQANSLGANAVVGVRFTTSTIAQNVSEFLSYGTAVRLNS